jgi:cyclopropane fatty-acyl-phospholipid synthase-like methyltransferase
MEEYDKDYFENGLETGKSCYKNYRWLPELTIPFAYKLIKFAGMEEGEQVLDFGCAKGFLVYALRLAGMESYGYDTSRYAIQNCHPHVVDYVDNNISYTKKFDWIVSKDVFEHIPNNTLVSLVRTLAFMAPKMVVLVPYTKTTNKEEFVNEKYEQDPTHINRKTYHGWMDFMKSNGWYSINHVDDKYGYYKPEQYGNALYVFQSAVI